MLEHLWQPFVEFAFMRRALFGGVLLAMSTAPLGVFLMLRRMSLMGDAISHGILPGAALAFWVAGLSLPALTLGGLGAGLGVAGLSAWVTRNTGLREDASLAALYPISLASGVLLLGLAGKRLDLLGLLFGSALAVDAATLEAMAWVAVLSLALLAVLYRPLLLDCLDPLFLRSVSRLGPWAHGVFLGLVVLNLVVGFQAIGALMMVGLMTLPAAAARFWTRRLPPRLLLASLLGGVAVALGLLLSFYASLPSGPAIVVVAGAFYLVSVFVGPVHGVMHRSRLPIPL
ncbi:MULTISPECIES: metal ABC transporter permease [unclassified Pseudomonas]|uniref:metal ABC transporter permease n=1 Tax=unclassified Pseudomonas TaxID=196821 RepID=UPI000BD74591|nr:MULTISPECIES: metal ABC transporter permease [unclassified Pseudomonas]PVZ19617.1 zinc/manganese transport system permease protein [Pseudomonas sp. URIL14HWK12:I12]PVZ22798.1 zinc/manganese transport system permease protein [Pseudomonas sp. URIL14HWK12:I10]PVZ37572.1 zinc/manganese transport system permease protein [Pseudomonas sp. URIL14HWK12:I11]SNZ15145.1 zinc/manganese transport system permease protein [Pseudomonas sp. URIL14HWK12:I9]